MGTILVGGGGGVTCFFFVGLMNMRVVDLFFRFKTRGEGFFGGDNVVMG